MKNNKKNSKKRRVVSADKNNVSPQEINLTDKDRITYVYKRDDYGQITEVTNVSYDINVVGEWITIVRYDSSHGYLHRHLVISISNLSDTPTRIGVKKKGDHATWLTWAINDIKSQYESYRKGFLRRSKI